MVCYVARIELIHLIINLTFFQGIDLIAGGRNCGHKTREAPKSDNVYLALLVKVSCLREKC